MMPHEKQWLQLKKAIDADHLGQAHLFLGSLDCQLPEFVKPLLQLLLCQKQEACLQCADCLMVSQMAHPDVQWIAPEKPGSGIKIEAIRDLKKTAYLSPQRAKRRIMVIEAADRLHTAAGNALLKILEEPPKQVVFILLAQQLNRILPTIVSRCQLSYFKSKFLLSNSLLSLGLAYPKDSPRFDITQQASAMLGSLISLIQGKTSVVALAAAWVAAHALEDILWFLYLVYAELQIRHAKGTPATDQVQLQQLQELLPPLLLFKQLQSIRLALQKVHKQIPMNATLQLEAVLLSLCRIPASSTAGPTRSTPC